MAYTRIWHNTKLSPVSKTAPSSDDINEALFVSHSKNHIYLLEKHRLKKTTVSPQSQCSTLFLIIPMSQPIGKINETSRQEVRRSLGETWKVIGSHLRKKELRIPNSSQKMMHTWRPAHSCNILCRKQTTRILWCKRSEIRYAWGSHPGLPH